MLLIFPDLHQVIAVINDPQAAPDIFKANSLSFFTLQNRDRRHF